MKYIFFLLLCSCVWAAPIRVGIVDITSGGGGSQTAAQLNNDTYFDFTASVIAPSGADSLAELSNYDVVIIGGSGSPNNAAGWTSGMASSLRTWVEQGGGLLATGWYVYERNYQTSDIQTNLGAVVPGAPAGSYTYTSNATLTFTGGTHPITTGLPSSFVPSGNYVEHNSGSLPSGDLVLGTSAGNNSFIVRDNIGSGDGRSAYLGILYVANASYNTTGLTTGTADRLLEQTVAWLADGGTASVVPAISVNNPNFGNVRVGTSISQNLTVTNIGSSGSTLTGTINAASGDFSPTTGTQNFSLASSQTSSRSFTYTPSSRGTDSLNVSVTSNAENTTSNLSGTGVSPVFASSLAPNSTVDFGVVEYTNSRLLTLQNATPDADLGNLTDLTILSATISGADAAFFSLSNFTPGMVLSKNELFNLWVTFNNYNHSEGLRNATLTLVTDQNAAFGQAGTTFTWNLSAQAIPEPTSISSLVLALGIGLGWKQRRRRKDF